MKKPTKKAAPAPASNAVDEPKRKRDPVKSRHTILRTASAEFCQHGFSGARVERIAAKSKSNMRMIYHYFGDKEGLYLAVLEDAYARIRKEESKLDLADSLPEEGMRRLIGFTFDFFASNNDVLALISNENTLRAKYLRQIPNVRAMTVPLIQSIERMLEQGQRKKIFRPHIDPIQFYVSLVALSQIHIVNRYTLAVIFDRNTADPAWLADRKQHTEDVLMSYLRVSPKGRI
jgi:TetR/AcrR family transcriptional regulator